MEVAWYAHLVLESSACRDRCTSALFSTTGHQDIPTTSDLSQTCGMYRLHLAILRTLLKASLGSW
jgi:hypothetical protein